MKGLEELSVEVEVLGMEISRDGAMVALKFCRWLEVETSVREIDRVRDGPLLYELQGRRGSWFVLVTSMLVPSLISQMTRAHIATASIDI